MTWNTCLTPRRVAGIPSHHSVYLDTQPDGRARFFVMYGQTLEFTACYPSAHEGLTRLGADYMSAGDGIVDGCPICAQPLDHRNAKAIYCSDKCRDIANWRRKAERRKKSA